MNMCLELGGLKHHDSQCGNSLVEIFIATEQRNHKSRHFSNAVVGTLSRQIIARQGKLCYQSQVLSDGLPCLLVGGKHGFHCYIAKDSTNTYKDVRLGREEGSQ